ncbi:MAG: lamin tail domain-containing protein [Candidatus Moraniibacteriota bacterium]
MFRTAIKILICWCLIMLAFVLLRQIPITNAGDNPTSPITFCEILPNPDGSDTKDNEYFKLANSSSDSISLANWKVCNISSDCYSLKETISANSCLKIPRTAFVFTLHNDKEELTFFDQNGNLTDKIVTGTAPSGKAWQCLDAYCDWGTPQESCDYSFLTPEEIPPPQDNNNSNDNSSETNRNDNGNITVENSQSNSNTNTTEKIFGNNSITIDRSEDFSRIRKILRKKKLISVLINIKGIVAIPQGLMAKTYFYLSFKDNLIKTHVYSSCLNSPDCLRDIDLDQGKKLNIQAAILKMVDGRFEIYLDKNTQTEAAGNKKLKKVKLTKNNEKPNSEIDFNKQIGKIIKIWGVIVAKKGDYFFIEDAKSLNIVSVYLPKPLQNAYAKKYATVPLGYYPFYQATIPNKVWLNSSIEVSGVVETAGQEYRIIAYNIMKLQLNNGQSEEKKEETAEKKPITSVGSGLRPEPENSRESNGSRHLPAGEAGRLEPTPRENQAAGNKNDQKISKDNLKKILAQNLSWQSFFSIAIEKFKFAIKKYF